MPRRIGTGIILGEGEMRSKPKGVIVLVAIVLFGLSLLGQAVSQAALDKLEDEINGLLEKGGQEYITAVCIFGSGGDTEIHTYFIQELAGQQYASKMTLVASLVGNLTEGTSFRKGLLKFFETEKNMMGWLSLEDCREATKIDNFKERQEFILSKLRHDGP